MGGRNKNVNILLKLQDQFSDKMVKAGKITKDQAKAMYKLNSSVLGFSRSVRSGFTSAVGHVAKFGAAVLGIGGILSVAGIKQFCSEAIEGFNAATEAETKLEAVLGNVPSVIAQGAGAATATKDRLVALTDKLEETGVVAGDVAVAGLQQLATFQLTEESLTKLTPGLENLIAQQKGVNSTQEDAVGLANLLGKAMTGQTGALTRAGIIMTDYQAKVMKTGTEAERAAMMAEILEQNVGGVNEALAQTDAGKIAVTTNLLGRAQDEIGGRLMHLKAEMFGFAAQYIPALQNAALKAIDVITPKIEGAMTWVADHTDDIKAGVLRIKDGVATAWKYVKPVLSWAIQHANTLIPAVLGVTAAISSVSVVADVATKVGGLIGKFRDMKKVVKEAGGVLAWLKTGPIGLIILGIAAAVAAVIYLWNNCEGFRNAVKKIAAGVVAAFNWIKDTAIEIKDGAVTAFNKLRDGIVGAFNKIKEKVKPVIDWITDKIEAVKEAIEGAANFFKGLGFGGGSSWGSNTNGYVSRADYNATGTPYWKGGLTHINEGGRGEIVDLPSGTRIIPHDVAKKSTGGPVIHLHFTVQGNVIGNRDFMEQTGEYVSKKIVAALGVV